MDVLLALLERLERRLVLDESDMYQYAEIQTCSTLAAHLGQTPPDGTGLLWSEVKGGILLVLVELAEVLPLLLVHDSEDAGNGLADRVAGKSSCH